MTTTATTRQAPGSTRFMASAITHEQLFQGVVFALAAGTAFFNLSNFSPDKDVTGLDKFVVLKLLLTGSCGLLGCYGWLAVPRVRALLLSRPGIWLTGIAVMFFMASLLSPIPLVSLASTVALTCMLLFTTTVVVVSGPIRLVQAILAGIGLFLGASWIAYLLFPGLGVFAEPLADGEFSLRMAGISHPNALAQYAALGVGLSLLLVQTGVVRSRYLLALIPLGLGALVLSISRASAIALVVALMFVWRDRILARLGPVALLTGCLIIVGGLLIYSARHDLGDLLSERWFSKLAKSGDTSELTSLTGRTEIWSYATGRLTERPWLGFGPATSKLILAEHVQYTHNLWLNVAFSSGLAGLLCLLGLTVGRVWDSLASPNRIVDFIIVVLFVNGLAENVAFAFVPGAPTMLLVVATLWRANEAFAAQEGSPR